MLLLRFICECVHIQYAAVIKYFSMYSGMFVCKSDKSERVLAFNKRMHTNVDP
jgi:hypothetical protein